MAENPSQEDCEKNSQDSFVYNSQFSELLRPIRELTKQHCWELNIAEKLDEYVHYIQDLHIEVNVNGEQMKLDFAKAAMVVQNSVQIYSKKVEYLWLLVQEVIEFLCCHGKVDQNEDPQKLGRNKKLSRKHQKGVDNLLEPIPLTFRKGNSKNKKKTANPIPKKVQILPYEVLQLEEVIGNTNCIKAKLYTLSKEHLGYPSDLRSNFPFNIEDYILRINSGVQHETQVENNVEFPVNKESNTEQENNCIDRCQTPDLVMDCCNDGNDSDHNYDEHPVSPLNPIEIEEHPIERMQLRERHLPEPIIQPVEVKNPWQGLEPYLDEMVKKPIGQQATYKVPAQLLNRKRKATEKVAPVQISRIDEFLSERHELKSIKTYCKPSSEFWEDFVIHTKAMNSTFKNMLKFIGDNSYGGENNDKSEEDEEDYVQQECPLLHDESLDDGLGDGIIADQPESPCKDLDESKEFFDLVQQFMADYIASAKEYAHSTESTRRVQAWHEMIHPRLQEAESRRDFDIHKYGSSIIDGFGTNAPIGSQTSFSNIIQVQPKNEVARYFLAVLQLANAYNVEISTNNKLSVDGVQLKLLSRERHHEQVEGFSS